jgi:hypothetical protein
MRQKEIMPFEGDPPQVAPGDTVWCHNAFDQWVPMIAHSDARYDYDNAISKVFLTVLVGKPGEDDPEEWHNWPAEDVQTEEPVSL